MIRMSVYAIAGVGAAVALSLCPLCRPPVSAAPLASLSPQVLASDRLDSRTDTLHVEGMTCGGCVLGTRKVLTRLDGVKKADVSYEERRAIVTYDPGKVTVEQMIAAIRTLGYKATLVNAPKK